MLQELCTGLHGSDVETCDVVMVSKGLAVERVLRKVSNLRRVAIATLYQGYGTKFVKHHHDDTA